MKIPIGKIENFVSDDAQQGPAIKCIWLDVQGKRLLATNGHMAIRVSVDVAEDDVSGLIPVEAFELARKELKLILKVNKDSIPDPWLNVVCNADTVFIQNLLSNTTHLVPRPKLGTDEKFPSVDAVFPELTVAPSVTLDMQYMSEVAKSLQLEGVGLSLWVSANDKVVVMACPMGKAIAVLMPQRSEVDLVEVNSRGAAEASR